MQKANLIKNAWKRSKTNAQYDNTATSNQQILESLPHMSSASAEQVAHDIMRRLLDSKNTQIRRVGRQMYRHYTRSTKYSREAICHRILQFMKELREGPVSFTESAPTDISSARYRQLIKMRQDRRIQEGSREWKQLEDALLAKVCHCFQKQLRKDLASVLLGQGGSEYNPAAICTSAVYNNRGFTIPYPGLRQCKEAFSWYRDQSERDDDSEGVS